MFRLNKISLVLVVLLWLALPACNFSGISDITPPPGNELSSAGSEFSQAETLSEIVHATETPSNGLSTARVVFTGRVSNLSGGQVPAGLQVKLQTYQGMEIAGSQTTILKEDATYEFSPLDVTEGQMFILSVEYNGSIFSSGIIDSSALSSGTLTVDLDIYENTTDVDGVYIDLCHIFISTLSRDKIQVVVYLLISNDTQKVVTAAEGEPVLRFSLPKDSTNLKINSSGQGTRFLALENGFGDTADILPGAQVNEILYSYELPYDMKRDLSFVFPIMDETGTLVIPKGMRISGENLTDAGEREMSGSTVHLYTFSSLSADEPLELQLSGGAIDTPGISSTVLLLLGLGVFIVVVSLIILWMRQRSKSKTENEDQSVEVPQTETQEAVLDAIIALDSDYEKGIIRDNEYSRRREQLRAKYKAIQK